MSGSSPATPAAEQENAAWASVTVPMSTEALAVVLRDVERLFRLNPYYEIATWQDEDGPFRPGKRYRVALLNEMNGVRREALLTLDSVQPDGGYTLTYDRGLKRATQVSLGPDGAGARLTLKDHYHAPDESAGEAALREVDRSLVPWAAAARDYLRGQARWSWFGPYRWYRGRFWLGMSPRQRRITRLIGWITLLEFVVFLFVFAIYWLESQRG